MFYSSVYVALVLKRVAVVCLVGNASETMPYVATGGLSRKCFKILGADIKEWGWARRGWLTEPQDGEKLGVLLESGQTPGNQGKEEGEVTVGGLQ